MSCEIRIGTSGFHYKHWVGRFYPPATPAGKMLAYYVQHFDTLELNNSFYRLPQPEAFDRWREATPPGFVFAVKASRFLTHNKKLKDPENSLDLLLPRVERLKEKLGPILFQLPPRWKVNHERLEQFLRILPRKFRYAFEFRELSWISESTNALLERFNAAFCIYELAGYETPLSLTADFAYIRLHGPAAGKYQGDYSDERLEKWARQIENWAKKMKAVYIYFDNDQEAYAARNAAKLRKLLPGK